MKGICLEEVANKNKHHAKSIFVFPTAPWELSRAHSTPECLLTSWSSVFIAMGPVLFATWIPRFLPQSALRGDETGR